MVEVAKTAPFAMKSNLVIFPRKLQELGKGVGNSILSYYYVVIFG